MKSVVLFFCSVLLSANLFSQTKGRTGVAAAANEKKDTAYVDSLNKKSADNYLSSPDWSRALAEKAVTVAKFLHYRRGEGMGYAAIGYSYWAQSCRALSLYNLFNAIQLLKETKEYAELSTCDRLIARNYTEMEEYDAASRYLKEAQTNAFISKNSYKIELVYNEASFLDLKRGDYQAAWATAKTAMGLAKTNKDSLLRAIIYSRLANILFKTGKITESKAYFDSSFDWAILSHNNRLKAYLYISFSEYYLALHKPDSAFQMAQSAAVSARAIGNTDLRLRAALLTAQSFKSKDAQRELEYRRAYDSLQDSVRYEDSKKSFTMLQNFLTLNERLGNIENQDRNNALNEERLRFQRVVISALMVFVAILLAGLFTIYFLYNEKRRLANQLADRNNAITEQKNIIEEQSLHLSQLNDLKTKLFAVISHDLRTPISSLRSIMGLFQQDGLTGEQTVLLLRRMLPALDGADLTLSNLLNWSIKQMNGLKINKLNVSVLPMAEEMQNVFEFALQQKNIRMDIQLPADAKVYADEHHLKIILRNLVSNAIKFTPQNGSIVIGERASAGKTTIWVKDNGKGIRPEDLPKLFTATTNFTTKGTSGEKGTGLGLVLCKELLELNHGTIYVESIEGTGSTFYFELPEKE